MISSDTKFFPEEEAAIFEKQLFNFWQKGIDKRWFWLAFQALQNSGLTYFESEKQEMEVRERIVLLSVIYYEYCLKSQAAECPSFNALSFFMVSTIKFRSFKDVRWGVQSIFLVIAAVGSATAIAVVFHPAPRAACSPLLATRSRTPARCRRTRTRRSSGSSR